MFVPSLSWQNELIIKVKRERETFVLTTAAGFSQAMVSKLMAEKAIEGHWQQVEYMLHGKLPPAL